jgi:PKD domain
MEAPRSLSGSRRVLAGQLARGLCLGALILALLGSVAAPAGAATGPGVLVTGPGVTKQFIEASELAATAPGGTNGALPYTLRANPGEAGELINRGGMPVREVITKSGADPDTPGYFTVPRPDGTTAYLPGADLSEPPPFPQGPALISVDVNSTHFFRPVTADPNDVNAEDNIATPAGEALTIGLHDGNILTVQAVAAPTSIQSGQAVQFYGGSSGGKSGEVISYRWSFGDGGSAEGPSVSHTFSGSGTYAVRVTATGSAESGGESGPVEVVVGNPPTTPKPGAAPTKAKPKQKHKADDPSGKGGQGGGGSGSGSRGGSGSSHSGNTGAEPGGGDGSAEPAPNEVSGGSTPAPATPEPEPTVPPEGEPPPPTEANSPAPAAKPAAAAPPRPSGELVEGTLVADLFEPAAAAAGSASSSSGSDSAPGAIDHGGGASVPVAALIVLGLLASGLLFEWRRARPRLR